MIQFVVKGKNRNGNINMKTLMKTAMKTIMKSSLCAIAALLFVAPSLAETYVWNTDVTSGTMSEPSNWLVDGVAATVAPGADDDVVIQSTMTNQYKSVAVTIDADFTFRSLTLSGSGVSASGGSKTINAGKLILGEGCPKFICKSGSTFGKFESTGACAVLETSPNSLVMSQSWGWRRV